MNKIFRKLKACGASIEAFPGDYKAFGIDMACLKFRRRLGIVNVKTYIEEISNWMEQELHQVILTFVNMGGIKPEAHADLKDISPVWVCWLQGEKRCLQSARQASNN